MRMHLLTDAGESLGDTHVPEPEPCFHEGITALRFPPVSIYITRTGAPAWALVTQGGRPWNIFEVTVGQTVKKRGTVDIESLYMLLSPNVDLIRRVYPHAQISEGTDDGALKRLGRAVKQLGMTP